MSGKQKAGKARGHGSGAGFSTRMSPLPWIALAVVLVVAAAFVLLQARPGTVASEVSAAQAYEQYQAGAFFLDVRTDAEYADSHIAKSALIPLDELQARLDEVPRDQDVVVICRSGARSKQGAAILREAGYTRVSCLTGGLLAWTDAGYPVEQGQ